MRHADGEALSPQWSVSIATIGWRSCRAPNTIEIGPAGSALATLTSTFVGKLSTALAVVLGALGATCEEGQREVGYIVGTEGDSALSRWAMRPT